MAAIRNILIIGGGTAGWLTAAFLARTLGTASGQGVAVTLVESKDIGILGVGEGTFPSIKGTLAAIGIDEARFLRGSDATFKQGVKFVDWVRPRGTPGADHYFHPFNLPSQRPGGPELLPYWLLGGAGDAAFAEASTMQKRVADAAHGPKRITDGDFLGPMNYAYHFDAARFAGLLCEHAQSLGVKRIEATVERVELDQQGAIAAVVTREAGRLEAGLYVDCTGFRAALIGGALGSPFHSLSEVLFVDRALAMQVPYPQADTPIASYTISTAHEAGWSWDIGLDRRRGIGYVYSSRYTDDARAEQVLRRYIGPAGEKLSPRQLRFDVGYRKMQWIGNCVAVGLSAGFLEPLESSGIGLIETAAYLIAYLFPHGGDFEPAARHFNELMSARYARIVDFLKMHYCLSQRRDSQFWIDNADPAGVPDTLKDKLAQWRWRPPHRLDFVADLEMYLLASWQFVLYGMEFRTDLSAARAGYPRMEEARREFRAIGEVAGHALADLPPHRKLVEQIYRYGLAKPQR